MRVEIPKPYLEPAAEELLKTMPVPRKALFLDRDGVINIDHGYVCSAERTDFADGIFELVAAANANGLLVVVVTNQAGIARGYYTACEFRSYSEWMCQEFRKRGAHLDAIYYCPHHPTIGSSEYVVDCECRKPKAGMLFAAQRELEINLGGSLMIGDKTTDVEAGFNAGVGKNLLLGSEALPELRAGVGYLKGNPLGMTDEAGR